PSRPVDPGYPALGIWSHQVGEPWADAMSFALSAHRGRWALGWRWARGEGNFDGGPVASWCCTSHSITTPDDTLARVAAAWCEWREWLEQLADRFEAYPLDPHSVADQRVVWQ